jgi:hypothetical protein
MRLAMKDVHKSEDEDEEWLENLLKWFFWL